MASDLFPTATAFLIKIRTTKYFHLHNLFAYNFETNPAYKHDVVAMPPDRQKQSAEL